MAKNKVKYNLKNAHYAVQTEDDDGNVTYGTPVAMPGSVSLSFDAQGDINKFYADGIVYYKSSSNNGYEGDLEMAMISESFRQDVLGETMDDNGVLVEVSDAKQNSFALLFEFDGDQKSIRHVLYNCTATRPGVESQTKEDTIEPVTETITISNSALSNGLVKTQSSSETDEEVYDAWYSEVYMPEV